MNNRTPPRVLGTDQDEQDVHVTPQLNLDTLMLASMVLPVAAIPRSGMLPLDYANPKKTGHLLPRKRCRTPAKQRSCMGSGGNGGIGSSGGWK